MIGNIALGLVWGWLAVLMGGRRPQAAWRNGLPIGGLTATLLFDFAQMGSWSAAWLCGGGMLAGVLLHVAFLQGLAVRYQTPAEGERHEYI